MYHFREFAKKLNLVDQLPGYNIAVRCDRILIDGADYRLDVYGVFRQIDRTKYD